MVVETVCGDPRVAFIHNLVTAEEAEEAVVLGAYFDDVLVGVPAALAANVPGLAAQAFAGVGCVVGQQRTKVWVLPLVSSCLK